MRLNQFYVDNIKELAGSSFGEGTSVFLFGSRIDDKKKGGDIDLFIRNENERALTVEAKVHFLAKLKTKIGDRKIDVVFDNIGTRKNQSFYSSILKTMEKL